MHKPGVEAASTAETIFACSELLASISIPEMPDVHEYLDIEYQHRKQELDIYSEGRSAYHAIQLHVIPFLQIQLIEEHAYLRHSGHLFPHDQQWHSP
jgi:hypothetical protein